MKRTICQFLAVSLVFAGASLNAFAGSSAGEVDFGQLAKPGNGGDYVEINVTHNLAALAAQLVEKQQPEAAKILRNVERVHVNVVGVTDENRAKLKKRIHEIRSRIHQQGWESVVTVQKQSGEDVGIYVKTRGDEAVEGIVITVFDGKKDAVLVNVVGNIKPGQLSALGEALHIDPLKKLGEKFKK
ncbi:MAG TPA: DUF4252 domain-containing protein [Verrucomicrobiae bacterium]|nr:DUF4252 domain-containing protein [Verrucomicrobiae bacterium]